MFPLLDKEKNKIVIINASTVIEVRENKENGDAFGHFVRVLDAHGSVLFNGTQVECEFFLAELFYAIRDTRGSTVQELADRAGVPTTPEASQQ